VIGFPNYFLRGEFRHARTQHWLTPRYPSYFSTEVPIHDCVLLWAGFTIGFPKILQIVTVKSNNLKCKYLFIKFVSLFFSDLLIFPQIHLMLEQISFSISHSSYESLLPNISRWYSKMKDCFNSDKILNNILDLNSVIIGAASVNIILPE
jgi:hypothetical protein